MIYRFVKKGLKKGIGVGRVIKGFPYKKRNMIRDLKPSLELEKRIRDQARRSLIKYIKEQERLQKVPRQDFLRRKGKKFSKWNFGLDRKVSKQKLKVGYKGRLKFRRKFGIKDKAYTRYNYRLGRIKFGGGWIKFLKRKQLRRFSRFSRFSRNRAFFVWSKFLRLGFRRRIAFISLRFTYRNCWVTLLKGTGDVIKTYSCGQALLGRGRYGERKMVNRSRRLSLPVLAEMAYLSVRKLKLLGLQKVYIILRCFPVFMVEIFMRVLVDGGIRICGLFSQLPVAHNGCKLSNCRRI